MQRIKCPVLLISIDTDHEFPPLYADEIADILNAARPGQATTKVLESLWGHFGCVYDIEAIGKYLSAWLPTVA